MADSGDTELVPIETLTDDQRARATFGTITSGGTNRSGRTYWSISITVGSRWRTASAVGTGNFGTLRTPPRRSRIDRLLQEYGWRITNVQGAWPTNNNGVNSVAFGIEPDPEAGREQKGLGAAALILMSVAFATYVLASKGVGLAHPRTSDAVRLFVDFQPLLGMGLGAVAVSFGIDAVKQRRGRAFGIVALILAGVAFAIFFKPTPGYSPYS